MERRFDEMKVELERMRQRAHELERRLVTEMERVRKELKTEIVPYGRYEAPSGRPIEAAPVRVRVTRTRPGKD